MEILIIIADKFEWFKNYANISGRVQFDCKKLRNIDFKKFINGEHINDNSHGQRLHLLNRRRYVPKRLNSRLIYCDALSNT